MVRLLLINGANNNIINVTKIVEVDIMYVKKCYWIKEQTLIYPRRMKPVISMLLGKTDMQALFDFTKL